MIKIDKSITPEMLKDIDSELLKEMTKRGYCLMSIDKNKVMHFLAEDGRAIKVTKKK
jgi:hypothetical protein